MRRRYTTILIVIYVYHGPRDTSATRRRRMLGNRRRYKLSMQHANSHLSTCRSSTCTLARLVLSLVTVPGNCKQYLSSLITSSSSSSSSSNNFKHSQSPDEKHLRHRTALTYHPTSQVPPRARSQARWSPRPRGKGSSRLW